MSAPLWYMVGVFFVYTSGIYMIKQRKRKAHYILMGIGILADIALTAYIEFSRNAIDQTLDTASDFSGNRDLLWVHVSIAVALLISYPVIAVSGWRLARNVGKAPYSVRHMRHKAIGFTTFALYIASFLTAPGGWIESIFL